MDRARSQERDSRLLGGNKSRRSILLGPPRRSTVGPQAICHRRPGTQATVPTAPGTSLRCRRARGRRQDEAHRHRLGNLARRGPGHPDLRPSGQQSALDPQEARPGRRQGERPRRPARARGRADRLRDPGSRGGTRHHPARTRVPRRELVPVRRRLLDPRVRVHGPPGTRETFAKPTRRRRCGPTSTRSPTTRCGEDDRLWLPHALGGLTPQGRYIFDGDRMLDWELEVDGRRYGPEAATP